MPKTVVLAGPTAIGKTGVSIALAEMMNCAVVSCDVMQSYIGLDVGTAKVTFDEMKNVSHFMVDEFSPEEQVTVSRFSKRALSYIEKELVAGKDIILAGGSGLYTDSIVYSDYNFDELECDEEYKSRLSDLVTLDGKDALYALLKELDSDYAAITHPNNVKRVTRALEYIHCTGKKFSEKKTGKRTVRFEPTFYFFLTCERAKLYDRIERRVDKMVSDGLFEEVSKLSACYKTEGLNAFEAIGYKECIAYFNGECSRTEAIENIKKNTRHYAKRQITWFNANEDAVKINTDEFCDSSSIAERIRDIIYGNK